MGTALAMRHLWRSVLSATVTAVAAGLLLGALSGCATQPSASNDPVITETPGGASDEGEARRRARIRLELASNYFDQGKTTVALDEVRQVLAADPGFAEAYNLRGLIYMRLNDERQAEEGFKRALALSPRDSNILHNYGWLLCQRKQYAQAQEWLDKALAQPGYLERPKTWMAKGLCLQQAGLLAEAQQALLKGYELDPANPVIAYHLSNVMLQGGDAKRAQFYIRRLNSSPQSNAESLWLGIKIERALQQSAAMRQLADQLHQRFPESRQWLAYERGAFNE